MKLLQQAHSVNREPELPLDHAPPKVRAHGLRDAHVRPLVSRGKRRDGSFPGSFRVSPQEAWQYPSIELRTSNSWPVLVLDCDGPEGTGRLIEVVTTGAVREPNWIVTRRSSGGSHVVYCLGHPVHRGEAAREAPLKAFARISEWYSEAVGADAGYTGILTHNPMSRAHGPDLTTTWGHRDPYELRELAEIIPFGWRVPKVKRTDIGRNCDLFRALMRWAGSTTNLSSDLLAVALATNQAFEPPLDHDEVAGIARSVERYRKRWIAQGYFYGPEIYDHSPEYQAWRGRRLGAKRRKATAERDRAICAAVLGGASMRSVARNYGLDKSTVRHIVNRDLPLWKGGGAG